MRLVRPLGRVVRLALALALALLATARPAVARESPARVSVLTMGPGQHPFTRFGHNAILLEWDGGPAPRSAVYNFGTFEFDGLRGVEDFMAGRFRYWLSLSTLDHTRRVYAREHRSLVAQELALTPAERALLADALAKNVLPAHRYYDYDYYRDNCSTRVRDALDRVLGGQLHQQAQGLGRLSFRQHTLRLVGDAPWLYAGLDIALGAPTNRPTTRWDELFLPGELHDTLASVHVSRDGKSTPLVTRERRLLDSSYPAAPSMPPERRPAFALLGLVLGSALYGLGRAAATRRALRIAFGIGAGLLGLGFGLLGSVFAGFWAFSKHWAAHRNPSLLLCAPWALALVVVGIGVALGKPKAPRALTRWSAALLVPAALALLLSLLPLGQEESQRLALGLVPLWAGLWLGARALKPTPA